ncbi:hypothetical protein V493_07778 [Pseudogymnoascus sp. VKM F-4281 (FW-2241)]|nr:hypothetical protein V493_07778 [Pseudogymnoascus sp. VKM F-4281 (FW-2241)]
MVHATLNTPLQRQRLMRARNHNHHLPRLEYSLHAHRQRHLRHLLHVPTEEARIGEDSVVRQSLDAGATREGGAGLVEGDVPIWPDATEEEVNAPDFADGGFHVDVLGLDVDVGEEVGVHEGVVGRGVVGRDAYVFVHVEGDDILEGDAAGFVGGDEESVDDDWAGAGGEAEDEGLRGGGVEVFDSAWRGG